MDKARLQTVGPWLAERTDRVLMGWRAGNPAVSSILNNWHPKWVGEGPEVLTHEPALGDAQLAVAREHGFPSWDAVEAVSGSAFNMDFEGAVDLMLAGDAQGVRAQLKRVPAVVWERSPFGHRATLLHYIAANGVETERQVVPTNATEVVAALLDAGADPRASMPVYGQEHTVLELLVTSAHPAAAGVTAAVAELLSA